MSSKENKDEPKDQGKKIQRTRGRSSMTVQEREELKQVLLDIEVQTQQTQKTQLQGFANTRKLSMTAVDREAITLRAQDHNYAARIAKANALKNNGQSTTIEIVEPIQPPANKKAKIDPSQKTGLEDFLEGLMDRLARQKVANDARLKNTLEQKQQVTQTLAQVEQARAQAEAQSLELKTDLNKLDKELKETQDLVVFCAQVHASITQTAASSSSSSSSSSSASASSSSSSPSSSSSASALGPMNELQGSPLSHLEQSVIEQLALAASKKRKHSE